MNSCISISKRAEYQINDVMLLEIYHSTRSIVSRYVYRANIVAWRGQEIDVIDDIVQDVVIRIVTYIERLGLPIKSLTAISRTIARNYCHDLWRTQKRRASLHHDERMPIQIDNGQFSISLFEENTWFYEQDLSLIRDIVDSILTFPMKQRTVLLIEIARHLDEIDTSTEIHQIFEMVGINIQSYLEPIPISKKERSRYSALLSLARKRLREAPNLRLQDLHLIK